MERDAIRQTIGFGLYFLYLIIMSTTSNSWDMNALKLMLNPSLITFDTFYVALT